MRILIYFTEAYVLSRKTEDAFFLAVSEKIGLEVNADKTK